MALLAPALQQGRNVIISGKYGMGRTSLLLEAEKLVRDQVRCVFCDFGQSPSAVCESLAHQLFSRPSSARRSGSSRYLALRGEILRQPLKDERRHVLVLDDIGKLTPARTDLLRALTARFGLVAVVERFFPARDHLRLASWLEPATRIVLGRLPQSAALAFFAEESAQRGLGLSTDRIEFLARASGGYPLRMQELAREERLDLRS